ncbi:MAG: outer membrane protein assembly factor BamD [Persicimonas sp.]
MELRNLTRWLLVALLALTAGCATGGDAEDEKSYSDAAEARYAEGVRLLEMEAYTEAIQEFNSVRNRYPYSKYAPQSELRIGDAYFEQEQFASAIEQYRAFMQLYSNHPEADYAHWRVARSFYELMPDDWFLLPPSHQRDLASAEDAERELKTFVDRFPNSEYAEEARKLLRQTRRRLADHEMYVAEFYRERENPKAVVMRLRHLLTNYSGLGLDPKALYLMGQAYLELDERERAKAAFDDLLEYHPDSDYADNAKRAISRNDLE